MALTDVLDNSFNQFDDTDPQWRQYISDHKQYLIDNSILATMTPSFMQGYRYSLKRYLSSIQFNLHCAWIVSLINAMPTDVQFTASVNQLYIPSMDIIEALYTSYLTAN